MALVTEFVKIVYMVFISHETTATIGLLLKQESA